MSVEIVPWLIRRMLSLELSSAKMSPAASTAIVPGAREAFRAGPPSPEEARFPLPATVVMMPPDTLRMRKLPESEMKRLPAESTASPVGLLSEALVAGPPSPENPPMPLPATVVIRPFETLRTRAFRVSAI